MPRLSIVIACPNDAEPFETTLASVLQNRPVDCEVIVVTGHGSVVKVDPAAAIG